MVDPDAYPPITLFENKTIGRRAPSGGPTMIYVEYIERDRFMPLEIFRQLGDQSSWTAAEDALVGSFGRTMRLGPMPSYLAFWQCKGMARMDEWEAHFNSPEAQFDHAEKATHRAIHLQHGGCYDELRDRPGRRTAPACSASNISRRPAGFPTTRSCCAIRARSEAHPRRC